MRAPLSGLGSRVLLQQKGLALRRTAPSCSACGQTADHLYLQAVAPEEVPGVSELQEVVLVPSELAKSCKPLHQASASPLQALIHVRSLRFVQLRIQHLGFSESGHPCSGPLTLSQGLETHLCSGLHRTLASCYFDGGRHAGCRCEQQGQRCAALVSPVNQPQELVGVVLLPW